MTLGYAIGAYGHFDDEGKAVCPSGKFHMAMRYIELRPILDYDTWRIEEHEAAPRWITTGSGNRWVENSYLTGYVDISSPVRVPNYTTVNDYPMGRYYNSAAESLIPASRLNAYRNSVMTSGTTDIMWYRSSFQPTYYAQCANVGDVFKYPYAIDGLTWWQMPDRAMQEGGAGSEWCVEGMEFNSYGNFESIRCFRSDAELARSFLTHQCDVLNVYGTWPQNGNDPGGTYNSRGIFRDGVFWEGLYIFSSNDPTLPIVTGYIT